MMHNIVYQLRCKHKWSLHNLFEIKLQLHVEWQSEHWLSQSVEAIRNSRLANDLFWSRKEILCISIISLPFQANLHYLHLNHEIINKNNDLLSKHNGNIHIYKICVNIYTLIIIHPILACNTITTRIITDTPPADPGQLLALHWSPESHHPSSADLLSRSEEV